MPTELKEKYPFSVDSWTVLSKRKRHHFLTHAHSDHTSGIEAFANRHIYCSDITLRLLLRRFPKLDESRFIILEVGEAKLVADDEEPFTVTTLDANHCPGAVMLLFEGNFGNVLHTGDCRLTEDCLKNVLNRYKAQQRVLDCVFLDCTFGRERLKMPSKKDAFRQVQQCILNHPLAPVVYLACDLLGQEELLTDLVAYFRTKIFVDRKALPEYFADMMIVAPDLVTENPESTRFHICEGFPKLYERAKLKFMHAHKLRQPEPLFIRPSAQWYTYEERLEGAGCGMILEVALKRPANRNRPLPVPKAAERDQYGVWHVCYSIHSSRSELERAMQILWPKEVISTTPHCHASEVTSERTGLHHVDVSSTITDRAQKDSEKEGGSGTCAAKRTLNAISVLSSPRNPRVRKKACAVELLNEDLPDALTSVVPLFGMARHCIPPSPPLSFASTESHSDEEFVDSPSTMECFPNGCRQTPSEPDEEWPPDYCAKMIKTACKDLAVSKEAIVPSSLKIETIGAVPIENNVISKPSSQANSEEAELDDLEDKENTVSSKEVSTNVMVSSIRNNQIRGVGIFKETTRKLYRSLRAPVPSPLPSLLDLYSFS